MAQHPSTGSATAWAQVGLSQPHESAELHVRGQATYVDDIPELQGTLHAALGLSQKAHADIESIDLDAVRRARGVVAVFTARDIPGTNDCGPIVHDDPVLADGLVQYVGQPIFVVAADTHENARRAARLAQVKYRERPAVLDTAAARAAGTSVVPALHLQRGNFAEALATAPHTLSGEFQVGGQEHFYLEGQVSYAIPREGGGMRVHCSTQAPSEMQQMVAHALALPAHDVSVECRRMGGGFGGKESQSALWAIAAALCASKLRRPVKLRADRDDDMLVSGKRHPFDYTYTVGFDGEGRILAAQVHMLLQAGFSADLSGSVATRAVLHFDNAYYLPDVDITAVCCRTHTQSNTAFRGFGSPQGALVMEHIVEDIARRLGKDALDVRKANFYGRDDAEGRNVTHYGQKLEDNVIHALMDELEASSGYRQRRAAIEAFNATSPVLKKGIAVAPMKFGISFAVTHWNQAGALVHVYLDGSVLVNHGGTEMGQGLNTKVAQVVAHELGLDLARVRVTATDTSKVANTSATAASTGADLNGRAAQNAAEQIRQRLAALAAQEYGGPAQDVRFSGGQVHANGHTVDFATLVAKAYLLRIQLWSDGFFATPGIHWDKHTMQGRPYAYFVYGAAVSEVVVDTLTGEWKLLRADVLHDVGQSLNPAIDIGQIEGGFIQGMGWLTTEELKWNAEGRLTTHAPSTYKVPAISDCPSDFRVRLYANTNHSEGGLHRSKAVGEPPLLLPFSVFFAIRDAVASVGPKGVLPPLNAPATGEEILRVVDLMRAAHS
ncbi:xanthine dehydrogenase molybdopterin binding subunit [Hydrogenophaga sp. BPS33]|uniref:xanthine dehydrogenase molybdopterin binding subunit n=1 Tax=Hydrogenophaga sp. BPS33 TaxID=2651974 RepID=UPI00131FF7DE|nr:xanthine dehydrogenase molybdopterin binding subunit [Hydrogenophaga sp. BPS33]QHE83512.1 xanthine dehydrogenase molybdopterin binding subunit [Hydrogenophaga sp. BPS33]